MFDVRLRPKIIATVSVILTLMIVVTLGAVGDSVQTIRVDGRAMRIRVSSLEGRTPGQPVVILEAGANSTLGTWNPVFARLADLAPTVAYDRSGLGQSEFDGARPTLPHVAQTLHTLLATAGIAPPYVMVGHSWGGPYIRGFASLYPSEVAGLVYVEPSEFERTDAELADRPPSASPTPSMSPPVPSEPPAAKAEMEQIIDYSKNGFADVKALRPPVNVPTAVIIATRMPEGFPSESEWAFAKRLQIRHQAEWITASPKGRLVVSTQSGHWVMGDAPDLVVEAVGYVLRNINK